MVTESSVSPVAQAIQHLGGPAAVATLRGLKTAWGASKWTRDGLPAEHVIWLSERTEWKFTPHQLRPDLYPHPDDGLPADRRAVAA